MPTGQGRKLPPPGHITPKEAGDKLGHSRLYKLVKIGKIQRVIPPGYTHGYFVEDEVNALYQAEQTFFHAENAESGDTMQETTEQATFALATLEDMDALYTMAVKLFPRTATAEQRRTWLSKEPQGHYIVKMADGRVVAYLYLLALKRDRQDVPHNERDRMAMYLHRQLTSSMITPDDLRQLVSGEPTEIAIAGIGSDPDIDPELRTSYTSWLLYGASRDLERMGRKGILLTKAYAFSETRDGIALCARLGMQQWEPPQGKVCTFVSDVQSSTSFLFRRYRRALNEWQAEHRPQRAARQLHTTTVRDQVAVPDDLPPDTIHFQDFLAQHNLKKHRRKILGYIKAPRNGLHHHAYPKLGREDADENDRYFTPAQQEALLTWLRMRHPEVLQETEGE